MNEITLKALKGSVEKWHNILHHDGEDNLRGNCPLCMEFSDIKCRGCPVAEKVGKVGCDGTPYEGWSILQNDLDCIAPYKIQGSATREAAQAEYDFLKDLYIEALEATPAKKEVDCPNCGYEPQPGEILVLRDPEYSGELFCPSCKKWYADTLWRMQPTKPRVEKEEWVDITNDIRWESKKLTNAYWVRGTYNGKNIVLFTGSETILADSNNTEIKIEVKKPTPSCRDELRILKRV